MTDQGSALLPSWRIHARRFSSAALNLIFPPVCVHCGDVGHLLCADCRVYIPWLDEPICQQCGRVTAVSTPACSVCRERPLPLAPIRAATLFDGPVPEIIHQLKYNGMFGLAELLAGFMVEAWPRWQHPVDLVVPVPLHAKRLKDRGYNQSALLVSHFCRQTGLTDGTAVLKRVRYTQPQVGLDAVHRQQNVQDAFQAVPEQVGGKRILLVDDVCTTGSTLAAAADALIAAGATAVSGYCLARAM